MSTESSPVGNFLHLERISALMESATLDLFDGTAWFPLTAFKNKAECPEDVIADAGLRLRIDADQELWNEAASAAQLEPDDIRFFVIAEDTFLKERDVLVDAWPINEMTEVINLASYRQRRPRSLLNSRSGLDIEVAAVLSRELSPLAGRPHRKGTRLASVSFHVRSQLDAGGINPKPLTAEVIKDNNLHSRTQLFVNAGLDPLLEAEVFSEAVEIYVNADLLAALAGRRSGPEYDFIGTELAVCACQQLVYLAATELAAQPNFDWGSKERPVLAFLLEKVNDGRPRPSDAFTQDTVVDLLRNKPHVAAAYMTSMVTLAKDAIRLVSGPAQEE